jgi:hypothetical protein
LKGDLSGIPDEPLQIVLELKQSVALECMAIFLQPLSKRTPTCSRFTGGSSLIASVVISASEPVTAQGAKWRCFKA